MAKKYSTYNHNKTVWATFAGILIGMVLAVGFMAALPHVAHSQVMPCVWPNKCSK